MTAKGGIVIVAEEIPTVGLNAGDRGVVVGTINAGEGYEVAFLDTNRAAVTVGHSCRSRCARSAAKPACASAM